MKGGNDYKDKIRVRIASADEGEDEPQDNELEDGDLKLLGDLAAIDRDMNLIYKAIVGHSEEELIASIKKVKRLSKSPQNLKRETIQEMRGLAAQIIGAIDAFNSYQIRIGGTPVSGDMRELSLYSVTTTEASLAESVADDVETRLSYIPEKDKRIAVLEDLSAKCLANVFFAHSLVTSSDEMTGEIPRLMKEIEDHITVMAETYFVCYDDEEDDY